MVKHKRWAALGVVVCGSLFGCGPGAGFLGLQDYGRDILFGIGGRLATLALLNAIAPQDGDGDQTGQPAPTPGATGPAVFSVQVDNFLTGRVDSNLGLTPVPVDDPALVEGGDALAYTAAIPSNYDGTSPLVMRLRMFREGLCDGTCFILSIDARCIRDGGTAPECVGGTADDCGDGTRFVRVNPDCAGLDEEDNRFVVLDLPLGDSGLAFPVAAGDFLAFELNTIVGDGGVYSVLGVEIATGEVPLRAEVFRSGDSVPQDCQ